MDADHLRRFWDKVRKTESCWLWTATLDQGYGRFSVAPGRSARAPRVAYELFVGPIPADRQIDHLCRNRACVNPAHLELVTSRTNTLRGEGRTARNARKTHCPKGHAYAPENTLVSKNRERFCLECRRLACEKRRRLAGIPALPDSRAARRRQGRHHPRAAEAAARARAEEGR